MSRIGVPFAQASPPFDEDANRYRFDDLTDEAFALEMAQGKADSLADSVDGQWILAADQIGVLTEPTRQLLCKPGTEAAAVEQLMSMSGRTHHLTTGVVLRCPDTGTSHVAVDRQAMTMRAFDRAEATAYITTHRPLDCAGSYRIEDAGILLFESIDGHDYTGIVGLPLLAVGRLLRAAGLL